jgi:hypothetical protein
MTYTKQTTELIPKDSIEEIVAHRDRAMELYRQAHELVKEAEAALAQATFSSSRRAYGLPLRTYQYIGNKNTFFMDSVRVAVDKQVWQNLILATALGDVFDSKNKEKFNRQLDKEPPECTVANITSTMLHLAGEAGNMFEENVYELFSRLPKSYRTNKGFGIGSKIILTRVMSSSGISYYHEDELQDMDRIFHLLDGKPAPERYGGLVGAIQSERKAMGYRQNGCQGGAETDYFSVKWFKNGNLHVDFKRQDLVDKLNKVLSSQHEKELCNKEV